LYVKGRRWGMKIAASGKRIKVKRRQRPGFAAEAAGLRAFRHLALDLHDPASGRLDAKRISAIFGLPLSGVARIVGRELSAVHKTPDALSLQPGLTIFERIAAPLLYLAGSPENLRIWLNAPNPELEGETPVALLKSGEGEVVAELLEDTLVGQPG
jgi:hypothetical protein